MAPDLPPSLQESLANSKCEYRQLGRSGLRVSVPILGCMSFGDARAQEWAIEEEEVRGCPLAGVLVLLTSDDRRFPCSRRPTTAA